MTGLPEPNSAVNAVGMSATPFFTVNPAFDSLRALGQITSTGPNFAAPTAPFGKWFSLDGVHPTEAAHTLIANHLIDAIKTKLFPLGDDLVFICGHGPMSTIGEERQSNPFLA